MEAITMEAMYQRNIWTRDNLYPRLGQFKAPLLTLISVKERKILIFSATYEQVL